MNDMTFSPADNPVNNSKSDIVDTNFGGNRKVTENIFEAHDYTKPRGGTSEVKENPVDETEKDIDEKEHKQIKLLDTEANFIIKLESDNKPLEDTDPVINPNSIGPKRQRKADKYNFTSTSIPVTNYEGEIS